MRRSLLAGVCLLAIALGCLVLGGSAPPTAERVELFGHVLLVQAYDRAEYSGCHAMVELRDTPGTKVVVMTTAPHLQSLLETAIATGYLMFFTGWKDPAPPTPSSGTWSLDVYQIDSLGAYSSP